MKYEYKVTMDFFFLGEVPEVVVPEGDGWDLAGVNSTPAIKRVFDHQYYETKNSGYQFFWFWKRELK